MTKPTLLMTRPLKSGQRFVQSLSVETQKSFDVIYAPLLEIVPTEVQVNLSGFEGVIFTSANGVAHAGLGNRLAAYCVGLQTTEAAQAAGWDATCVGETAEVLIAELQKMQPKSPLLHLVGVHQRGDIAQRLTQAGFKTECCIVYDQRLCGLTQQAKLAIRGEEPVFVPLFSPRTAAQFAIELSAISDSEMPHLQVIALSKAVAEPLLVDCVGNMHILSNPTAYDMRHELEKQLSQVTLP